MSAWLWVNLSLGALFVLAIVGIPLWLVMTRPDTAPDTEAAPAWRRGHVFGKAAALPAWRPAHWSAAAVARRDAERAAVAGARPAAVRRVRPGFDARG